MNDIFKKRLEWFTNNNILTVLLVVFAIGVVFSAYFTILNEYIPSSQTIIFSNATLTKNTGNGTLISNKIFDVGISYEKNIFVSALNFMKPKTTTLSAFFYLENNQPVYIKNILLSASNAKASLNTPTSDPSFNLIREDGKESWVLTTTIGHTLQIQNSTSDYNIYILYRIGNSTGAPIHQLTIPIKMNIQSMDMSVPVYFWVIFSGVILSRLFSYSNNSTDPAKKLQLNKIDLLWVPFSAIITLLIFVSFKEQITLTTDVLTNLALAFGFGFGFDKVFETLQKK